GQALVNQRRTHRLGTLLRQLLVGVRITNAVGMARHRNGVYIGHVLELAGNIAYGVQACLGEHGTAKGKAYITRKRERLGGLAIYKLLALGGLPVKALAGHVFVKQNLVLAAFHTLGGVEVEQVIPLTHAKPFGKVRAA